MRLELSNQQDLKQEIYAKVNRPDFDGVDGGTGSIRLAFQKGNMREAADKLRQFYRCALKSRKRQEAPA